MRKYPIETDWDEKTPLVSRQVIKASFGGAGGEAPAGGLGVRYRPLERMHSMYPDLGDATLEGRRTVGKKGDKYIPAFRFKWLTRFFDPFIRWTVSLYGARRPLVLQ